VQPDRTFAIAETESDGDTLTLDGHFEDGTIARGTFEVHATIIGETCDTGAVSWTAHHG
jgi:hypothetical protein